MLKDLPDELINKVFYLSFEHPCSKMIHKAFYEDVKEVEVIELSTNESKKQKFYINKAINQINDHKRQIQEFFTTDKH